MSKPNFSPGPWTNVEEGGKLPEVVDADGMSVLDGLSTDDANLISAALDLLEALEDCLQKLQGLSKNFTEDQEKYVGSTPYFAKEAIKKARGETK